MPKNPMPKLNVLKIYKGEEYKIKINEANLLIITII